jgi:D-serine deaminase-like pyridoxal phosphate-dependent protein
MIGDVARLRPHIKTHKTIEIIKLCQAEGVEKYKCATIAEAELLGICEVKDALLAYQPIGPKAIRFSKLMDKYPKTQFSCLVDSLEVANSLSELGKKSNQIFSVYIDLNIGQNRTGIQPDFAKNLVEKLADIQNIKLVGIHAYDGHIYDKNFEKRQNEADLVYLMAQNKRIEAEKEVGRDLNLIMSGSPTYSIHAKRKNIDCSPGTFVFWDKGYTDVCAEQAFLPAVLLVNRIISLPTANYICIDLGYKSVAAENELSRRVFFQKAPELKFISQSEEHLVLSTNAGHTYKIGDILFGTPIHICPTIALHEKLYVVENEQLTGETWKVLARNRTIEI